MSKIAQAAVAKPACRTWSDLFEASLRLLHPVMPFITEEIWQAIYDGKPPLKSIALAAYPQADEKQIDLAAETQHGDPAGPDRQRPQSRAELKVEHKAESADSGLRSGGRKSGRCLSKTATPSSVWPMSRACRSSKNSLSKLSGARSTARFDVHVVYEKKIDVAAERERLKKELEQIEKEIGNGQRQLSNEQFLAKAPAKVVEGMRARAAGIVGAAGEGTE